MKHLLIITQLIALGFAPASSVAGNDDFYSLHRLKNRTIRSLSIHPTNPKRWLVGHKAKAKGSGLVFETQDSGVTWKTLNNAKPLHADASDVQAVWYGPENIILAGTWRHGLFRSKDNGQHFQSVAIEPKDIRDLKSAPDNPSVLFAATGQHGVWRSADAGIHWRPTGLSQSFVWSLRIISDGQHLYAVSPKNGVFESFDSGLTWSIVWGGNGAYSIVIDGNSRPWIIATGTGLVKLSSNHKDWEPVNHHNGGFFSLAEVNSEDIAFVAGSNNDGVQFYARGGVKRLRHRLSRLAISNLRIVGDRLIIGTWGSGLYVQTLNWKSDVRVVDAARNQDLKSLKVLLSAGADPNAHDENLNTALIFASRDGQFEIAQELIAAGANVNWRDSEQVTPLILAAFKGHGRLVEILLKSGADISAKDRWNRNALHYALRHGKEARVARLLSREPAKPSDAKKQILR